MNSAKQKLDISVIIPCFNEADSVALLHKVLCKTLKKQNKSSEIIFVDDGSTDSTMEQLKLMSPIIIAAHSKNLGKSQALQTGFSLAQGDLVITMDGDMQDDPSEIPRLIETLERTEADLVCGWKKNRQDPFSKRIISKIANFLIRMVSSLEIHDINCGLKIMRSEVAKQLNLIGDFHRFIPVLAHNIGFKVRELPVSHKPRIYGKSKFGINRIIPSIIDLISIILLKSFERRPMHLFGASGILFATGGTAILMWISIQKIFSGTPIESRPLFFLGILLIITGIQLFSFGFLGDMLIRGQNKSKTFTRVIRHD